ncbi:epoxide hydrolase N-terminal domain-containing protein [Micromonospora sp. DT43]|uniref:epoxide hydrolase N-terminal domain-containing protein n=1 Tax=Micromonospora sp. DT43 TaxID=3393440 RepID=UPI003CF8CEA9
MSQDVRPFRIDVPEDDAVDLRQRLAMTRWPDREPVNDGSQGEPLATLQEFVRYWETEYDWRKVEARLNAMPQFMTEIDGLDIHFIHVRPRHENAPIFPGEIYRAPRTWAERSYHQLIY